MVGDPDIFVSYNMPYTSTSSTACPGFPVYCHAAATVGNDALSLYSAPAGDYYIAIRAYGGNSITFSLSAVCATTALPPYYYDVVSRTAMTGTAAVCQSLVGSCDFLSSMMRVRNDDDTFSWISTLPCPPAFSNSFYQVRALLVFAIVALALAVAFRIP